MRINILLLFVMCLFTGTSQLSAQEAPVKKIETREFKVDGVCKMCKVRIEEAAMTTKGVKMAVWNQENQMLKVTYKPKKVELIDIHKAVAKAGHSTEKVEADEEAYEALPGCCKYDDGVNPH